MFDHPNLINNIDHQTKIKIRSKKIWKKITSEFIYQKGRFYHLPLVISFLKKIDVKQDVDLRMLY